MLTSEGLTWLAQLLAARLAGGSLEVSDGTERASAPFDSDPRAEDGRVVVAATFGEQAANFDWSERTVVAPDGTRIESEAEDQGRKAAGSVWTLEVALEPLVD